MRLMLTVYFLILKCLRLEEKLIAMYPSPYVLRHMEESLLLELQEELATKINACLLRLARYDPQAHPDYVADSIFSGESHLLLHKDGFSVVTPHCDRVHIWISCAYTGHGDLMEGFKGIKEYAETRQVERLTFHTERKGWKRIAERIGFVFTGEFYERNIA